MRLLFLCVVAFFPTGCAVHSPMSEMLMFKEKEAYDGRIYQSRYSHGILSFTSNLYSSSVLNQYAEQINPTESDTEYDYRNATSLMTNAIIMADQTDDIALSVGFGTDIGLDATINIFGNTYLTGAADIYYNQGQVILQRRIFDGNPFGLSLGASYHRNYQYVEIEGVRCGLCFPSEEFHTNSVGLRSVALFSSTNTYGSSSQFLYITASVNYDLTMETVYPKIGFSFGFH